MTWIDDLEERVASAGPNSHWYIKVSPEELGRLLKIARAAEAIANADTLWMYKGTEMGELIGNLQKALRNE